MVLFKLLFNTALTEKKVRKMKSRGLSLKENILQKLVFGLQSSHTFQHFDLLWKRPDKNH